MIEEKKVKFDRGDFVTEGTTYIIPPNPEKGFLCGFSVFVPKDCETDTTLILHSCNTGFNVPVHLDEANDIAKNSTYRHVDYGFFLSLDLKMPLLVPLIPRVQGYYTQALGSRVLHNDVSFLIEDQERRKDEDKLSEEEIHQIEEQCKDLPTQVANMIEPAKQFLASIGITVDDKVIAEGYSAGAKFANCFTALHPELVKACVCGGNTGLGIRPLSEYKGQELKYPLGVADLPNFDKEAFCNIPQLYYIGTEDYNDPACPKTDGSYDENGDVIPLLDSDGKIEPMNKENYTGKEIEQIFYLLGKNPGSRFNNNEEVYNSLGVNAVFKRFPGEHNTVLNNPQDYDFVKDFIRRVSSKEKETHYLK